MSSAASSTSALPRLSESAQRAISGGEAFRESVDADSYFTEFLLIGLAEKKPGVADFLLRANKIDNIGAIWQDLPDDVSILGWTKPATFPGIQTPSAPIDDALVARFSPNMEEVLAAAGQLADKNKAPQIRSGHLLYGILSVDCQAKSWLKNAGVAVDKAQNIIGSIPEEKPITLAVFSPYSPNAAINDKESFVDKLGFEMSASALAQTLLRPETVPPLVVGIYGAWGSGKSTYMNRVWANLEQSDPKAIPIMYDAWEYTDSETLWAGLVQSIAEKLDKTRGVRRWPPRIDKRLALMRLRWFIAVMLLLIIFGVLGYTMGDFLSSRVALTGAVGILGATLILIWEQLQKPLSQSIGELLQQYPQQNTDGVMHRIRQQIDTAVKDITDQEDGAAKCKVFIFIDNLDRCQLEDIVDILEGIKIFLNKAIFYVFLAVDTRVLSEAIKMRYKESENDDLSREYIEKIVQFPVQVPRAQPAGLINYVDSQMKIEETEEAKTTRQNDLVQQLQEARAGGVAVQPLEVDAGLLKRPEPMPDTVAEQEAIIKFADRYLQGNPRRIKRLLNTYRYVKIVCEWMANEAVDDATWQQEMIDWLGYTLHWPSFMANGVQKASKPGTLPTADFWTMAEIDFGAGERPTETDTEQLPLTAEKALRLANLAGHFLAETPVNGI